MTETQQASSQKSAWLTREWIQVYVLIAATLLGAYEFVLKELIRPAQEPTALELEASLEKVGDNAQFTLVRLQTSAHNPTDRRIYVPAYWYTVVGFSLSDSTQVVNHQAEALQRIRADEFVNTYGAIAKAEVLAQRRIIYTNEAWWEPQDRTHDEDIVAVPKGAFDYVVVYVNYLHTRFPDAIAPPEWETFADGSWNAKLKLQPHVKLSTEQWQRETGSGYGWYNAALVL